MKTFIVDSFTDRAFAGNPAGVCLTRLELGDDLMLNVARELQHSETAFVQSSPNSDTLKIRYFSPKMEIPLCGHATLAAAKVVFEETGKQSVVFENCDGLNLPVIRVGDALEMCFPVYDTTPDEAPAPLLQALGLSTTHNVAFNRETRILLLEIDDAKELAALDPDFTALRQSHDSINGVLVTAATGDDGYDFHSRYFWPWSGTDEDPVTGGTHTFLAPYWAKKLGKSTLRSFQCSARGGFMALDLRGGDLFITGTATIVFSGELILASL